MSIHLKYPRIHSLGKDEVEGILDGEIIIQEKVDGANLSIWLEEDGLYVGSRNLVVGTPTQLTGFNGAVEYANSHVGIRELLCDLNKEGSGKFRLFGEWLVPHTVQYPDKYFNKFWLFDIYNEDTKEFLEPYNVSELAKEYVIECPEIFFVGKTTAPEILEKYVGKSTLDVVGEGVVIKDTSFKNKYGDFSYAKVVSKEFKERNNVVFGNTHKDSLPELDFIATTVNRARLTKLIHKIEQNDNKNIERSDIPKLLGLMWNDVWEEELWDYVKKERVGSFNFQDAQKYCTDRTKVLFFDYISGFNSVAYENK